MPRAGTLFVALGLAVAASVAPAQAPSEFEARLSWVPISVAQQADVGGQGSATARLSRSRLSIEGRFEALPAPATRARLHHGVATGASGPAIGELDVTAATDGRFEGTIELDRAQRAALLAGKLYVQIHAARGVPPDDAVLRGWLLAAEAPRSRSR